MKIIYTIGHSNHQLPRLIEMLKQHKIMLVIDVRRYPSSRYNPQFNRPQLAEGLKQSEIEYLFMGNKLGGKDAFEVIKARPEFKEGISELINLVGQNARAAILCAEENPANCHRSQLLEPEFMVRGVKVVHIRGNGKLEQSK